MQNGQATALHSNGDTDIRNNISKGIKEKMKKKRIKGLKIKPKIQGKPFWCETREIYT